jgi:predicted nucleotide-binding protein
MINDLASYVHSRDVRTKIEKILTCKGEKHFENKSEKFHALEARWAELCETLLMVVSAIQEDAERPADKSGSLEKAPDDPSVVFVVHGRNLEARDAVVRFLRAIQLSPLEWEQAKNLTRKASPSIPDVLDVAFGNAQAVVVLFTPDEIGKLREKYVVSDDTAEDKGPSAQVRPNVFFEAGMAFGRHADRSIIIKFGKCRPFTDISGITIISWDNSAKCRRKLVNALKRAGCPVRDDGEDWLSEGYVDLLELELQSSENTALSDSELGLVKEAKEILKVAINKSDRQISYIQGVSREFVADVEYDNNNPENRIRYISAFKDLMKKELVRHVAGVQYELTAEGCDVAKRLLELDKGTSPAEN